MYLIKMLKTLKMKKRLNSVRCGFDIDFLDSIKTRLMGCDMDLIWTFGLKRSQ
jgi:hypothetical protein